MEEVKLPRVPEPNRCPEHILAELFERRNRLHQQMSYLANKPLSLDAINEST